MLRPRAKRPIEAEVLEHVRGWLNLLADGQFERACAQLDGANTYGVRWTPQMIQQAIANYVGSRSSGAPSVSRVEVTPGDGRPSVVEFGDRSGYSVEHDLPLNGRYSDLTVQMDFRWHGQGLAMVLHDVHVL